VREPGPALCRDGGVSKAELAAVRNFTGHYICFFWIKAYECITDHEGLVGGKFDDILGCDLAFVWDILISLKPSTTRRYED